MRSELARKLFKIYFKQPWLRSKQDQVLFLFNLFDQVGHQYLVEKLFEDFIYLDGKDTENALRNIALGITERSDFDPARTQLVATAFDYNVDSSQLIAQRMKPQLAELGHGQIPCISIMGRALRGILERPTIYLIDEFAGTGSTIVQRVQWLKTQIALKNGLPADFTYDIRVSLVAGMTKGVDHIRSEGVEVTCEMELPAAISAHPELWDVEQMLKAMQSVEGFLDKARMDNFPTLGYGQAEAIFASEDGNTPNSVFPVFWWRHLSSGEAMHPVLSRYEPEYHD